MNTKRHQGKKASKYRRWARVLHRDLSYIFTGILLVYLVSGALLNHRRHINPNFSISVSTYQSDELKQPDSAYTKAFVLEHLLKEKNLQNDYSKHFVKDKEVQVYLKGGSVMKVDTQTGTVEYTKKRLRWFLSRLNKLHYNPSLAWTIFSDLFLLSCSLIILTGLLMNKGKTGLKGRGGIELIIGLMIPLLFMFVF